MARLIVASLLLSCLPAFAGQDDYKDPAYWTRTYQFPAASVECRVGINADLSDDALRRIKDGLEKAGARDISVQFGGITGFIDADRCESACRAAVKGLDIGAFSIQQSPVPRAPELYDKRERLKKEKDGVGDALAKAPAISGLLNEELETLGRLISAYESALMGKISIGPGRMMPAIGAYSPRRVFPVVKRAVKVRGFGAMAGPQSFDYWNRGDTGDPCKDSRPGAAAVIEVKDLERANEEALRIKRAEEPRVGDDDCQPDTPPFFEQGNVLSGRVLLRARVSQSDRIQGELMGLGRLISWQNLDGGSGETAADKISALNSDLEASAEALKSAPYLESLVKAEIHRLTPMANGYEKRKRFYLINLTLQEAEAK